MTTRDNAVWDRDGWAITSKFAAECADETCDVCTARRALPVEPTVPANVILGSE